MVSDLLIARLFGFRLCYMMRRSPKTGSMIGSRQDSCMKFMSRGLIGWIKRIANLGRMHVHIYAQGGDVRGYTCMMGWMDEHASTFQFWPTTFFFLSGKPFYPVCQLRPY